ncbi:TetR/AcrR family transcriptional regulator [Streptomyces nodosus]|uniref:TetR family transcriptional regulator n=1 Tax=Streptomyces nodosus TaxID=40318 RepID=A0A0B5DEL6_9ACTN|nr:helix-turn-helix domain-containing protein [Streptomyces nodosus]AJE39620.1 TetR family transcriptional regulator [Streptomyces nodosus]MBB4790581.1 AcrR family transcriptional regulator [Streptomyces nodosus]QEV38208.1 TetR/AcrR family transcriptional regulator [Streptomyces nodosus]
MPQEAPTPSARQTELLEAAYRYALAHGLADLSLRPLAEAIGSSPRVLLYLFGSKDGLLQALLERARSEELALLDRAGRPGRPTGLAPAVEHVWTWLAAKEHRPLLRLWAEAYTRSLVQSDGAWAGFARATVEDWLGVLADCQPPSERDSRDGAARRTLALAVLRGALLDLLATNDERRLTEAVEHQLALLQD